MKSNIAFHITKKTNYNLLLIFNKICYTICRLKQNYNKQAKGCKRKMKENKYNVQDLEYDELFEIEQKLDKFIKEINEDYKKTQKMEDKK